MGVGLFYESIKITTLVRALWVHHLRLVTVIVVGKFCRGRDGGRRGVGADGRELELMGCEMASTHITKKEGGITGG